MLRGARTWIGLSLVTVGALVVAVLWLADDTPDAGAVRSGRGLPAPAATPVGPAGSAGRAAPSAPGAEERRSAGPGAGRPDAPSALVVRVVDAQGGPVRDARIELLVGGELRRAGTTDGQGVWIAEGLPVGKGSVNAVAGGFAPSARRRVELLPGVDGTVVLELQRGVVVEGFVQGCERSGVRGAQVRLVPRHALDRPAGRDRGQLSDPEGRFRFDDVAPGSYVLTGAHALCGRGHVANLVVAPKQGGIVRADLVLGPVGSIQGWVRSAEGQGIGGARVRAAGREGGDPTPREAVSRADGAFALEDLGAGPFRLEVQAHGWRPARLERIERDLAGLVVVLEPRTPVHLLVTNADDGEPIRDFRLTVRTSPSHPAEPRRQVGQAREVRDEYGHATIHDLDPGTYRITVQARGFVPAVSSPFTLTPGASEAQVALELSRGAAVEGGLVRADDGVGVEGADLWSEVWLADSKVPAGTWSPTAIRTRTDSEGRYRLEFPAAGRYRFVALPREHVPAWSAPFDVRPTDGVRVLPDLRLESGANLEVHVVDAFGEDAPGIELRLLFPAHADHPEVTQRTGRAGRVRFRNLPPGPCHIQAMSGATHGAIGSGAQVGAQIETHLTAGREHRESLRLER